MQRGYRCITRLQWRPLGNWRVFSPPINNYIPLGRIISINSSDLLERLPHKNTAEKTGAKSRSFRTFDMFQMNTFLVYQEVSGQSLTPLGGSR